MTWGKEEATGSEIRAARRTHTQRGSVIRGAATGRNVVVTGTVFTATGLQRRTATQVGSTQHRATVGRGVHARIINTAANGATDGARLAWGKRTDTAGLDATLRIDVVETPAKRRVNAATHRFTRRARSLLREATNRITQVAGGSRMTAGFPLRLRGA